MDRVEIDAYGCQRLISQQIGLLAYFMIVITFKSGVLIISLQCSDTIGWAAGRTSGL